MANPHELTLTFVINGVDVSVSVNEEAPLAVARNRALEQSKNTGRPFDEWQVFTTAGVLLDASHKIETFHFAPGTRLLLSLIVGAGG
jgi:hypothetical protein